MVFTTIIFLRKKSVINHPAEKNFFTKKTTFVYFPWKKYPKKYFSIDKKENSAKKQYFSLPE